MIVMRDKCHNKMMIVQIESYYSCHHCYSWLLYLALCSCIGTTEEFGRLMGLQNWIQLQLLWSQIERY